MHRQNATPSMIVLTGSLLVSSLFSAAGCRNTFPESQVRMQSRPSAGPDGIEEPPSRLYSAFGLGRGKAASQQRDSVAQASNNSRFANQTATPQRSAVRQASGESSGTSFNFSDSTSPQNNNAPLSQEEQQMLMEAFENSSPEIRQLAERRMSSLKAQAAKVPADSLDPSNEERLPTLTRTSTKPQTQPTEATAATNNQPADIVQTSASSAANKETATKPNPEEFAMPDLSTTTTAEPATPDTTKSNEAPTETVAATAPSPSALIETTSVETTNQTPNPEAAETPKQDVASQQSQSTDELLAGVSDQVLLDELIRREELRMSDALAGGESYVAEAVRLRTYRLFAGGIEQATQPVDGWTASEQEYLNHQTMALWHMIDPASHPIRDRRWATALPELRQATQHLAAATGNLQVHNLAFCEGVDGFGQIKPFPTTRFSAGQQVILYSEVENFEAERLSDGWETHLKGTYRILDSTGRRVAEQVLAEDQQTCNNYRRDYFLPYILHLPDRLTPGNYRFELTLEDVKGKKFGTASIPFEIIAATN